MFATLCVSPAGTNLVNPHVEPELGMVLVLIGIELILAAIPSWTSYRQPVSANLRS